ncbi:alpha/beta-hydrolase [Athelia psychrophila]|nr:alpha/beta-hydrolase [Fibularhizoctonia sp. CBS 109695]
MALIAPAGLLESGDISRTVKFMSSPLIQDITSSFPFRLYMQHLANTSGSTLSPDPIHEIVRLQSAHLPGYNRALASSIRSGPIRGQEGSFAALGKSGRSVLLIHGTADWTVPYKHTATIRALIPHAHLVTVDGAGHDLTVTHSDVVTDSLLSFFETRDSWVPKFLQS